MKKKKNAQLALPLEDTNTETTRTCGGCRWIRRVGEVEEGTQRGECKYGGGFHHYPLPEDKCVLKNEMEINFWNINP